MKTMTHIPSTAVLDLANSWRRLAEAQQTLDTAAHGAQEPIAFQPLRHEEPDRMRVSIEEQANDVIIRITPRTLPPDAIHVWATPDLLLLRAQEPGDGVVERLVRLPWRVEVESAEIDITDSSLDLRIEKAPESPLLLWPRGGPERRGE
ncbi:MAG: hypothetical protein HYX76_12170 [Acidobacteria bacterium]|nr:hypothetical protein [Acidobacteriota bacterium]